MADLDTGEKPEIDVDDMDDAQLASLKEEMRGEDPNIEPQEPEKEKAAEVAKTAPDPDAPDDDDNDETEGKNKSETVPHGQYHRERERRKAAETERQQLADNYAKLLERTQALLEASQPKPQAEPEKFAVPGPDDPLGRLNWTTEQFIAMQEQQQRSASELAEARRQEQAYQEAFTRLDTDYRTAAAADPSLNEAYNALRESQGKELLALGYSIPEAQAELDKIERQHVMYVAQRGISIADHIKGLAAVRGWAPKVANQDPAADPVKQIEQREEARKAALSLGKTGGGVTNTGAISPEQLLDMSDAEFAAYKAKHGSVASAFRT